MQRKRMTATAAALTAAAALLAGCGGSGQEESAPGGPAQQEQEHGQHQPPQGGEAGQEQSGAGDHSEADVEFLTGMIPHHQQAVTMSEMAPGRAENPQVREMADKILAAQGPEIEKMSGWLTEWGVPLPQGGDHGQQGMQGEHGQTPEQPEPDDAQEGHEGQEGHGAPEEHGDQEPDDQQPGQEHGGGHEMHGMLTPEQMNELRQANGPEFDQLYLSLMIEHHEGAVQMAQKELEEGKFGPAKQIAQQMIDAQQAEIGEMRKLQQP